MVTIILRVAFKFVALYCLLFLPPLIAVAATSDEIADPPPPVAWPNCIAICGNLTVPYPFGIGSGCFLDKHYEIQCHRGGNSTPVGTLKNLINVTVLNISLLALDDSEGPGGFIEVSQPVFYSEPNLPNCMGKPGVGSFSTRPTHLTGLRNNRAFMVNTSMKSAIVGCRSTCTVDRIGSHNHCVNGIGCCMNTIPYGLQAYSVNFQTENGSSAVDGLCSYFEQMGDLPKAIVLNFCHEGLASASGAVLFPVLLWWFYKFIKRRNEIKLKKKFFRRNGGLLLQQLSHDKGNHMENSKLFTSKELEKATDYFNVNRILGQGGQGTVYKGMLIDGRTIAVKRSRIVDEGHVEQFVNEIMILSQINHRNIVKLLGCCLETEVLLLVYEFIQNGTLYQHLHNPTEEFLASWEMRLRIAIEVAEALSYLHFTAAILIYHRDVKSSNILLDDKYRAKVADFGTSRSVAINQTHLTTVVKGTIGYLDPKYFQTSQFTDKSDMYGFGVVLVELLTGQKPISATRVEDDRGLAAYFVTSMDENRLLDIVEAGVVNQAQEEEIMGVANLAKRCLNSSGRNRPTMKEVAMELERIRAQHVDPSTPEQNHQPIDHVRARSIQAWHHCSTPVGATFLISWFESFVIIN
ncbi:hypothetical protein BT93_A1769 [Corymbia citriodora subsp. variegata]|nr:hypothetical protein BT93_A1769 [Corymbia citriodora subsp. variegata]